MANKAKGIDLVQDGQRYAKDENGNASCEISRNASTNDLRFGARRLLLRCLRKQCGLRRGRHADEGDAVTVSSRSSIVRRTVRGCFPMVAREDAQRPGYRLLRGRPPLKLYLDALKRRVR